MTDGTARPTELELKYRVSDIAVAERLISADRLGPFTVGGGRLRSPFHVWTAALGDDLLHLTRAGIA